MLPTVSRTQKSTQPVDAFNLSSMPLQPSPTTSAAFDKSRATEEQLLKSGAPQKAIEGR